MQSIKLKTTSGKTAEINRDQLVEAAVQLIATLHQQHQGIIVWGDKTTGRYAIVPYNSKLHDNE